jgi:hypothetical protein
MKLLLCTIGLAACEVGTTTTTTQPDAEVPADASDGTCVLSGTVDASLLAYDDLSGGGEEGVLLIWNASGERQLFVQLIASDAPFTGAVGAGVFDLASLPEVAFGVGGLSVGWGHKTGNTYDSAFGARAGTFEIVSIVMPAANDGSAHVRLTDVVLRELEPDASAPLGFGATVKPNGCTARIPAFETSVTVKLGAG